LTTFAQRSTSTRTKSLNCSGVLRMTSKPVAASRSFTSGSTINRWVASCSRVTISRGVPAGTDSPYHEPTSNCGKPASRTVGRFGNAAERCAVVMAIARRRPACICDSTEGMVAKPIAASPLTSAETEGPPPL
jgi:hypothetical protein